ncbi:hypothetical protein KFE25_002766 [Diacronema lutheri]|uniref:Uncharacterized protein n=1 Tax=Diacronema lutheri TaxID=2081491 RepID=A0A8J6CAE9_DIALT|nr:hypothetical protein KFE25_002766 [Diacronema lutheri]
MADRRCKGTSFKELLKVQATPDAGGGLGKIKEHRERLQDLKRKAPTPSAGRPREEPSAHVDARRAPAPPASSAGASGEEGFMPATMYAGPRPGFVFKLDKLGTGYYRDAAQPAPAAAHASTALPAGFFDATTSDAPPRPAHGASQSARGAQPAGSLPAGFFDNPREDPANASKKARVSDTQKGERLRLELAAFEKSIEQEVQHADAVDDLEDEADAEFRAAEHDREQQIFAQRVRALREHAQSARAAERRARAAAAASSVGAGGGVANAVGADDDSGGSGTDEESELLVDWRSKKRG